MKKIFFILILFAVSIGGNAQTENWTGQTAEQLSGITSGVTNIASKSYWTSNAYEQLANLYTFIEANVVTITANDTTPLITDASMYLTANTSTTIIDSLVFSGISAQKKKVTIIVGDSYTQVNNQSNYLETGVDLTCKAGDILQFYYTGSKWVGGIIHMAN